MMNLFIRNYVVNPTISPTSNEPIGGVLGSLRSIQKVCREVNPDRIICCWDGPDASYQRRKKNKDYKTDRKTPRLNRNINENFSAAEEDKNRQWQIFRLMEYLNKMPVIQLLLDKVEADDIIAVFSTHKKFDEHHKVIVSSDKDFIQLLVNEKTILIRPVADEILNCKRVITQFKIHPKNFALARSIVGDKSDKIDGIYGIGLKTVAKTFPFLEQDKIYKISDLMENIKKIPKKEQKKAHIEVFKNGKLLKENLAIIQLRNPLLSKGAKKEIVNVFSKFKPKFSKTGTVLMMSKDGILSDVFDELFQRFKKMERHL